MCAKLPPKKYRSTETRYFLSERSLCLGQMIAARTWLLRHALPVCPN